MPATPNFQLVRLRNGSHAVYSAAYDEKMHPGAGPAAEGEAVYVRQLKIRERMAERCEEFVVWDVGLGAAANAITLLKLTTDLVRPLRLVSFDKTASPAEFALRHSAKLGYFAGYEAQVEELLAEGSVRFTDGAHEVDWSFVQDDFPAWMERRSPTRRVLASQCLQAGSETGAPHAIMFDAFSPAKNAAMWTLQLFTNLFRQLEPSRPCNLATYSRSTLLRVTLLLAGFYVGRGRATGMKEETTVAANSLSLLDEPLDRRWLERARRSASAEPLTEPRYRQSPISAESLRKLEAHPQFCQSAAAPE